MKAIMISIKPEWCLKIMEGKKTIEVRKNKGLGNTIQKLINENGYVDIYVYCSKTNYRGFLSKRYAGKVIFKFHCYKVEEIKVEKALSIPKYTSDSMSETELCKKTCLSIYDLNDYLKGEKGYAIHISDLEIFDKPKELSDFQGTCNSCEAFRLKVCKLNREKCDRHLTKAPQNFCYIEVEE